ncbi:MAG: hypothetical protein AAF596_07985, partial [Planctomycetota bacterium]
QFGAHAVRLIVQERFGEMICSRPPEMTSVPIIDAVSKIRQVDPHGPAVKAARALGISFGDRPADQTSSGVFTVDEDRRYAEAHGGEHLLDESLTDAEGALEAALAE